MNPEKLESGTMFVRDCCASSEKSGTGEWNVGVCLERTEFPFTNGACHPSLPPGPAVVSLLACVCSSAARVLPAVLILMLFFLCTARFRCVSLQQSSPPPHCSVLSCVCCTYFTRAESPTCPEGSECKELNGRGSVQYEV